MTTIATKAFWLGAFERSIKTAAQAASAFLVASGTGILELDWTQLWSVTAFAALASVLTSLGSASHVAGVSKED